MAVIETGFLLNRNPVSLFLSKSIRISFTEINFVTEQKAKLAMAPKLLDYGMTIEDVAEITEARD
ncbi:hypothetical protein DSM106972_021210 [Dulcicalothrix desertica PCC 7102]|uniref:Uncharacterized protein n=1 Tax=Dulcicalothrix desertica PCC 7102 TaxID=232991 RepID=A0A433VP84_9CYAN|nr:hypothetical protein [Dulcicalothrix desertica]RUT07861.1 hypothetical protein DSM106972_021210 [Dulcicalothrix desertica PCC 7102]TWH39382.1 hypothetical protein CAL7102_08613 [Dulcicalothrix desertica PCC 7102]